MEKIPTGIEGLDRVLYGGIPSGSVVLISGSSGTGKTILGTQFLIRGAEEQRERGMFVSLDERPSNLREDFKDIGFEIESLEKKDDLIMLDAASPKVGLVSDEEYVARFGLEVDSLLNDISRIHNEKDVDRIVIDSLPLIAFRTEEGVGTTIYRLMSLLNELDSTALVITEREEGSAKISRYGVEQYAARGVILLNTRMVGNEMRRNLLIKKIRGGDHDRRRYPFEISKGGIEVYPYPDVYSKRGQKTF
ncbi:ATPase [archaeon SCG-AAA382B04]|nr:ATPase [archaeon SCG-AAA382B04]